MLSREHRISRKDFPKDFRVGKVFRGTSMNVSVFPAESGKVKATVVASSNVSKKAVERNRAKRIVRAIFHSHIKKLPTGQYVIHVKKEIKERSTADIKKEIDRFIDTVRV